MSCPTSATLNFHEAMMSYAKWRPCVDASPSKCEQCCKFYHLDVCPKSPPVRQRQPLSMSPTINTSNKTKMKSCKLVIIGAAVAFTLTGCGSLLTKQASPTSLPVQSGLATTNDLQSVAIIREVQAANAAFNPTPSEPIVNAALGALATLISLGSGWWLRHQTQAKTPLVNATKV